MNKTFRIVLLVASLGLFVVGASAQTGGILIGTNFGGDPTNMNPLISQQYGRAGA